MWPGGQAEVQNAGGEGVYDVLTLQEFEGKTSPKGAGEGPLLPKKSRDMLQMKIAYFTIENLCLIIIKFFW